MQISELRTKTKKELLTLLQSLQKELLSLRFDLAKEKLKDTSRVKKIRKDVARIKTVLREKEILEKA